MLVDELVDRALRCGVDFLELKPHADAAIAPGHARFGLDVLGRPGKTEACAHFRAWRERAIMCSSACLSPSEATQMTMTSS